MSRRCLIGWIVGGLLALGVALVAGCGSPVYYSSSSGGGYYGNSGWNDPGYRGSCCWATTAARIVPTVRPVCVRPVIDRPVGDDRRVCGRRGIARRAGDGRRGSPRVLDRHPADADRAAASTKFYEIDPRDGLAGRRHGIVLGYGTPGRGHHLASCGWRRLS